MKVYQVFDDGTLVLTTFDPIKVTRKMVELSGKYPSDKLCIWVDEAEVQ